MSLYSTTFDVIGARHWYWLFDRRFGVGFKVGRGWDALWAFGVYWRRVR